MNPESEMNESFLAIGISKNCGLMLHNSELYFKNEINIFHILNASIFDILKSEPFEE